MKIYNLLIAACLFYGLQAQPNSADYKGGYSEPITSVKGFVTRQKYRSECRHNLIPNPKVNMNSEDRVERWQRCVNNFVDEKDIKYKSDNEMKSKTIGTNSEYYKRDLDALCEEDYSDLCSSEL
jgi:hypothetical protein